MNRAQQTQETFPTNVISQTRTFTCSYLKNFYHLHIWSFNYNSFLVIYVYSEDSNLPPSLTLVYSFTNIEAYTEIDGKMGNL